MAKVSDMKNVIILFVGICVLSCCKQPTLSPIEELKAIGLKMAEQEHMEYEYGIKAFRSYSGDTSYMQGKIYFEINPKDTAIGYNFYAQTTIFGDKHFYNGDYTISLFQRDSSVLKKPLCDFRDGHMTVYPHLEMSYGAIKLFLTDTLFTSMTDSLTRKDTIFRKQPCVMFSFWADDKLIDTHKKSAGKSKVNIIFHKKDHLPLLYITYQPLKDGHYHYSEAAFSDYRFDVQYPDSMFSIENIPEYYQWDKFTRYYPTLANGSKAPEWQLPGIDGDSVSLSDFQNQYVLMNFWFIGCGACIESIPLLNQLQSKYRDKMTVVGVNCFSKNGEKVQQYCIDRGMEFQNVWMGDATGEAYKMKVAPTYYLIDKSGTIVGALIGYNVKKLEEMVASVL